MRRPSKIRAAPDEQRRFFLETVSLLPLQVILCYIFSQHHLSCLPLSIPFISTSYLSAVSDTTTQEQDMSIVDSGIGGANMEYAWYASSEDGICGILQYGFGQCDNTDNGGLYGCGLYLTPVGSSIESAMSSVADENGLRHLLLCRVILGNQEEVLPGSKQLLPSSEEFDSGVDNCLAPKKYIIWSTHMNTHVLPDFIISFRNPSLPRGCRRIAEPVRRPSSPWVPLARLISIISRYLPPPSVHLITRYYADYMAKKITRINLIRRLRQIAGDRLLLATIKSHGSKVPKEEVH
ncbi:hypothetical protein AAC387_Pa02g1516 [Persea americana]